MCSEKDGASWMESLRSGGCPRSQSTLGEAASITYTHALGGISAVPKVPLNLKTMRKQVSGTHHLAKHDSVWP
ncbi:mCG5170 [Mus musculus]|nr:mCG5170 [Mus musculus]